MYIIEANPRASRTVPFVAKAIGHPVAKYASLLMSGRTLAEIGFTEEPTLNHVAVKEAVLPFDKFPGTFPQTLYLTVNRGDPVCPILARSEPALLQNFWWHSGMEAMDYKIMQTNHISRIHPYASRSIPVFN